MPTKGISTKDLLASLQKQHGKMVGSFGGSFTDLPRLPTGVFEFDLASGGGFPRGKASLIYGPESSGKTNLALRLIALHQLTDPELTNIFFDVEHSWDPVWAAQLGVDVTKVIVIAPDYAEQCIDMVVDFLHAEDCGIVVLDSLAALVSTNEIESSAEKVAVAGTSNPVGKLVRKTTQAFAVAAKENRFPTLIYINQIRHKIGVLFGDPETMPGGNAPRFQIALWVRLYGKNKVEPKISKVMPVIKETTFIIKKWKFPILAKDGKFEMAMLAHDGLEVGQCDDWPTISHYLKDLGHMQKAEKNKGWVILDETYPTLQAFRDRLFTDKSFGTEVRAALITRLLQDGQAIEPTPDSMADL